MKEKIITCKLYRINDDFEIKGDLSADASVVRSKKKYLYNIIAEVYGNSVNEILTGEEFDYTFVDVKEVYSKVLNRVIPKEKVKRSSKPIHVSLFSEDLISSCSRNTNFENASESDISEYYNSVINQYGSIDNYRNYLVSLKDEAYEIYNNAIENSKGKKKLLRKK